MEVWEGEILPAAPACCGNNERGVDLRGQVGADQGRVQVRVKVQVKVKVPGPIRGGLVTCSGARVSRVPRRRARCGQARQVSQADGRRESSRRQKKKSGWLANWLGKRRGG
jgi:hypothetical protein